MVTKYPLEDPHDIEYWIESRTDPTRKTEPKTMPFEVFQEFEKGVLEALNVFVDVGMSKPLKYDGVYHIRVVKR